MNHNHWNTPTDIYEKLNKEFKFNYDACPSMSPINTLYEEWGSSTYCNPPYDKKNKEKFIKKAYLESQKGKTIVMLLPVHTSTNIFHELILPKADIRFIKKRLHFTNNHPKYKQNIKHKAPFDNMIVIFRPT